MVQTRRQTAALEARGKNQRHHECGSIARETSTNYPRDLMPASPVDAGVLGPPKVRNLSHSFKGNSFSSRRTKVYKGLLLREVSTTAPRGKKNTNLRHRANAKLRKIGAMKTIEPSVPTSFPTSFLLDAKNKVIFSNSTGSATPTNNGGEGAFTHLLNTMRIVNDADGTGCQMVDEAGDIVFKLLPRQTVLDHTGDKAYEDVRALHSLQNKKSATKRSELRDGVSSGVYTTTGNHANRGGKGIVQCGFAETDSRSWDCLVQMSRRCEETAAKFLPTNFLTGISKVIHAAGCVTMSKTSSGEQKKKEKNDAAMFAALANAIDYNAIDYSSRAHTDLDFWFSLLTVNVPLLLSSTVKNYQYDLEVAHHFVFPEFGTAVAIRPGDLLLFNPRYFHCLSHKEVHYDDLRVHATSFYLKTNMLGMNDNSIPLTAAEQEEEKLL
jgi:hypothetical protein